MLWVMLTLGLAAGPDQESRQAAVDRASRLLAETLGEEPEAVQVVRAEAARWEDAALGCPEPGRSYAQVVSDGYRVLLRVGRNVHVVHVSGERAIVCGSGVRGKHPERVPPSARPRGEPAVTGEAPGDVLDDVIADLAARKGVDAGAVEVLASEARLWPDGALGCPEPGQLYPAAPVQGYRVVLRLRGDEYDYRVGKGGWFVLCDRPFSRVEPPSREPPPR